MENIELALAGVRKWINKLSETGQVLEIEPMVLRDTLKEYGANFDIGEQEKVSLSEYTNAARAFGMSAVWGADRYKGYKDWASTWAMAYEERSKIELPKLEKSGSKISGMLQFFGELTAFAGEAISFDDFKRYTEARALNGKLWREGKKDERVSVTVPTAKDPIRLSSFPPEFPGEAWEFVKTWKK